jgi:hypothetical protein
MICITYLNIYIYIYIIYTNRLYGVSINNLYNRYKTICILRYIIWYMYIYYDMYNLLYIIYIYIFGVQPHQF